MNIVEAPDVENALVATLRPLLASSLDLAASIGTKVQAGNSVTLYVTGGFDQTRISDVHQVTFDVRAGKEDVAKLIARRVRGLVHALDEITYNDVTSIVYGVNDLNLPVNLSGQATGALYRWTAQLHIRSRVVSV